MGRRRFVNEDQEVELLDEESDPDESETEMTTQEEAFNRYSDFADATRKRRETSSNTTSSSKEPLRRKRQRFQGETPWDQMLNEFEKRKIPRQQAQMIVGVVVVLMFYYLFGGMFSSHRGGAGDLLDCFTVSSDKQGRDIVECRSRHGYNIRVIESHTNSLLLEVAESQVSEPGFISGIFSLVKYSLYITLGLTVGSFIATPEGKQRFTLLKRKYLEISDEIKRKIEVGLKRRDNVYSARGNELAGLSGSESESSDDESSSESESSVSR